MTRRVAAFVLIGVVALGSQVRAGTITVPAGGNLQQALNQAQPGDTILLAAGATYVGNFVLPAKYGSSYITIRSNAPDSALPAPGQRITPQYASQLPKLQSPQGAGGSPALLTAPAASYYAIQFIEFLPNANGSGALLELGSAESSQNTLAKVPHHLVVDRCYLHSYPGVGQLRGIALNSGATTIRDSYIAEIKDAGQDSQAIGGWNGPGPYTIVNNYLQAAGENFMLGGGTMYIPNVTPSSVEFRNNYVTKDPAWRGSVWTVKNIFELKHARDVVVDGNVFEYVWQAAQDGFAIVLTPRGQYNDNPWTVVENVTFTNNVIRHVAAAFNVLGWDNLSAGRQSNHFTFRNNVIEDVSAARWGGNGRVLQISETPFVTFDHNTIINSGSAAVYAYNGPSDCFSFTNNILNVSPYGIMGDSGGNANGTIAKYFANGTVAGNVMVACPSISTSPAGNNYAASYDAVGFVNLGAGDYRLASTSAYKGTATDGKDPGVDVDALAAALAPSGGTPPGVAAPPSEPGPPPVGTLPSPWTAADIGASMPAGDAGVTNGTFTIRAGGADIWGTADSFTYVYQPFSGDGEIVARVASLQDTNRYAKAGVMLRGTLGGSSAHVMLNVKPGGGLEFLSRMATGGPTTCLGSDGGVPAWVKLVRAGSTISGYFSTDGTSWTKAGAVSMSMGADVYVGLAVTSHDTSALTTAMFDNVAVSTGITAPSTAPSGGLDDRDIGTVTIGGSVSVSNGVYTVKASGADVWGVADAFHFAYQPLAGDGEVAARVTSLQNTDYYAKAGVMMRETLGASAVHVLLDLMPGGGIEMVARSATGGSTLLAATATATPPAWLKLVRAGTTITGYSSKDGGTWTRVGSVTVSMATSIYTGLAVCSHNVNAVNLATFDNVVIDANGPSGPASGYVDIDVGGVGIAGSASASGGIYTVRGAGADIWGGADAFNFVHTGPSEASQIVTRVVSMQNTHATAKAGITIREGLREDSAHVLLNATPSGVEFMTRSARGASTTWIAGSTQTAPVWLKLVRFGSTFTGYTSEDGRNWSLVGSVTVSMATTTYNGLVVCSHTTSALNTAVFDNWAQ